MIQKFEFEKLEVYQKAIKFAFKIYRISDHFPKSEGYGLTGQLKRSTTSIALNIAEGYGRYYKKGKIQFYTFARSSGYECIPILTIALHQNYIDKKDYDELYNECYTLCKMISALINSIKKRK
ncbi:MAG: four helix bundle protein [Thermoplasmata archaeon]|nr:MAG: four helix bundle protein [Thermoplasmata archaeon]